MSRWSLRLQATVRHQVWAIRARCISGRGRFPLFAWALLWSAAYLAPGSMPAAAQTDQLQPGRGEREIIFIHGLGSHAGVWDEVTPLFSAFRVYTYEIPGHGTTPPLPGLTIDKTAADLGQYIEEHDIVYPVLVGHGMGGLIAMRYTFDHPADVRRLIVIDAAPVQLASAEQKAKVAQQLIENYDRFVASRYIEMSPYEQVADEIVDQALRTDSVSFINLLTSSFDFDLTDELPRQSVPILVIGSAFLFPDPETARQTLDAIGYHTARTISFKRLDKIGHYPMLEQPVYLASVIMAFSIGQGEH